MTTPESIILAVNVAALAYIWLEARLARASAEHALVRVAVLVGLLLAKGTITFIDNDGMEKHVKESRNRL